MSGGEYFVMRKNEDPNDAIDYAFSRCEKLQEIEDACYKRPPYIRHNHLKLFIRVCASQSCETTGNYNINMYYERSNVQAKACLNGTS